MSYDIFWLQGAHDKETLFSQDPVGGRGANSGIPGLLQAQRWVNLRWFITGVFPEQELGVESSSEQEGNPQCNLVSINSGTTTDCITLGCIMPSGRIFQI